jgi:hypothetical protein
MYLKYLCNNYTIANEFGERKNLVKPLLPTNHVKGTN